MSRSLRCSVALVVVTLVAGAMALAFPAPASNPLGLTPNQKEKIRSLDRKARAEISAVRLGVGKDADKNKRIEAIALKCKNDELAVLTPAQRAMVEADRVSRIKKLEKIRQVGKTLTPQQQAKAKSIQIEFQKRAIALRSDRKLSDAQKAAQWRQLQLQMKAALEGILTSKQRAALPR